MGKLSIFTDSKFLIDSCTKWIHTWKTNGWKTADGKPAVNKTEFEELLKALAPLEVEWNHVPGHQGIEGNEATDQLARAATEKDEPEVMTPLEDGTFHKDSIDEPKGTTETMINISPNCTSSEDSDSPDEEPDAPEAVSDTQNEATGILNAHARRREVQKSVAEFEKSIAEHQSYFWDQEGLGQSKSNACPRLNITAVSEGEADRDLLLYLENMDPCADIDDPLPEQVNKFLEAFQKHLDQGNSQQRPTGTVQIERFDQSEQPPTERESRKSTVRFKEAPEFMNSPILEQ